MTDFQFWLNIGVQVFVGVVLMGVIFHKNSLISTLKEQSTTAKSVLDLYDIKKLKEYQDVMNETAAAKNKIEMETAIKDAIVQHTKATKSGIDEGIREVADRYSELVMAQVAFILHMDKDKRQDMVNQFPKNKPILEKAMEEILRLKPDLA